MKEKETKGEIKKELTQQVLLLLRSITTLLVVVVVVVVVPPILLPSTAAAADRVGHHRHIQKSPPRPQVTRIFFKSFVSESTWGFVAFVWKKKKLLYNPSCAVGNLEDHLLFLSSFVDLIESKQTKIFGISLSPTGTVCVRHIIGNQSNRPNGATSKFIR